MQPAERLPRIACESLPRAAQVATLDVPTYQRRGIRIVALEAPGAPRGGSIFRIYRDTRFAPGARILDSTNKLVMSSSLIRQELVVNYTLDQRGQVHQVWLLTEAEAKVKRPGYGTQRNFVFESQQTLPAGTPARTTN